MRKLLISFYDTIRKTLGSIKPPFFDGLSIWDVLYFFFRGIYEGAIATRAGSVSFSFFLALFPVLSENTEVETYDLQTVYAGHFAIFSHLFTFSCLWVE